MDAQMQQALFLGVMYGIVGLAGYIIFTSKDE
jgi:hypothetical protein